MAVGLAEVAIDEVWMVVEVGVVDVELDLIVDTDNVVAVLDLLVVGVELVAGVELEETTTTVLDDAEADFVVLDCATADDDDEEPLTSLAPHTPELYDGAKTLPL